MIITEKIRLVNLSSFFFLSLRKLGKKKLFVKSRIEFPCQPSLPTLFFLVLYWVDNLCWAILRIMMRAYLAWFSHLLHPYHMHHVTRSSIPTRKINISKPYWRDLCYIPYLYLGFWKFFNLYCILWWRFSKTIFYLLASDGFFFFFTPTRTSLKWCDKGRTYRIILSGFTTIQHIV